MRKEDVVAFARRDWQAVAALKQKRWAEQKSHMTPAEALQVGDQLRDYVRALRADWPSETDRRHDLDVHTRISESLRRVGSLQRR